MQFTASVGSEFSSFEVEANIGARMNRMLVRLGGFGFSVRVFLCWQGAHVEGSNRGKLGREWLLYVGPIEATVSIPARGLLKSRAAA